MKEEIDDFWNDINELGGCIATVILTSALVAVIIGVINWIF